MTGLNIQQPRRWALIRDIHMLRHQALLKENSMGKGRNRIYNLISLIFLALALVVVVLVIVGLLGPA